MEAEIRDAFPGTSVELVRSSGGVFEIEVDGELVYSKKETGRHAAWPEVKREIERRIGRD